MSEAASFKTLQPGSPLAFDPEAVPLDPSFNDPSERGKPVPAERLQPNAVQACFSAPPCWEPEVRVDARLLRPLKPPKPAAVLVPLVARENGLQVLLTQRTSHLHHHAGQISFPGGGTDRDDRDAVHTALRETQEEIGLSANTIDVLGQLPPYLTATGYQVTPVVGLIKQPLELATLKLDTFEVAEVFEVPLLFLMNPAHHQRHLFKQENMQHRFYSMPYQAAKQYFIWGATAAMLRNFYHLLSAKQF